MKQMIVLALLLLTLAACSSGATAEGRCNQEGTICLDARVEEPVIYGEPVTITITVTSKQELPDLVISFYCDNVDVSIETEQNWEKDSFDRVVWDGGVGWKTYIAKDQTLTFSRKVFLPSQEGYYGFFIRAGTTQLSGTSYSFSLYLSEKNSAVYYEGTPVPTDGPLGTVDPVILMTIRALPTETEFPTLTPIPVETFQSRDATPAYPPPQGTAYP